MYQAYDPEVLKRVQETELEILKDFIDLCDRHDIDYFGVGGTAIGAVRHQGFIRGMMTSTSAFCARLRSLSGFGQRGAFGQI